jgi:hypothetical protein
MATRRPRRFVPKDSSRRRAWIYVAVGVFILADTLLIVWALGATRSNAEAAEPRPVPPVVVPVETRAPVESTRPTPTPKPTTKAADTKVTPLPATRILAALDGTTAWRATTGVCPDATASPELTTDGGVTWKSTNATGPAKVTALQRIMVTSEKVASMVGLAQAGCSPQFVKTFIAGDNYASYPEELDSVWYIDPANRAVVHSPSGDQTAPCDMVVALASHDAKAAVVLCANGQSFATADGAATWSRPVALPGAIAITAADSGYLAAAAAGRADCAGVQILSLTNDLVPTPVGCYPMVEAVDTLAGNVALSPAAGTLWLWAQNSLVRSTDNGATWQ